MTYCQLAGFLFAVVCAPELVKPSDWIPAALEKSLAGFRSLKKSQRIMDLVMRLYNRINLEVREGRPPSLPAGIAVREKPMENFGFEAPLGQWALGYLQGQKWLEELWRAYFPDDSEEDADAANETLHVHMLVLAFFSHLKFAAHEADPVELLREPGEFEDIARKMLGLLPKAMRELADLGRALADGSFEAEHSPGPN